MYWYVKAPLIVLGCLLAALAIGLGWRQFQQRPATAPLQRSVPVPVPAPALAVTPAANLSLPALAVPAVAATPPVATPSRTAASTTIPVVAGVKPAAGNTTPGDSGVAADLDAALAAAAEFLQKENYAAARKAAEHILADPRVHSFDAVWIRGADILGRANLTLLTTPAPAPDKIRQTVQAGDTLLGLAAQNHTTVKVLERANKIDTARTTIYPGMMITVMPGNLSLSVIKSRYRLLVFNGDKLFKSYTVGIGRQNRTPVGIFKIANRMERPPWTNTQGKIIPYGDPQNVLGTHWLSLQPSANTDPALKSFGIHGTWLPESVGTPSSEGCIRLRNNEIAELFDYIPLGTKVIIRDE